jgi:hypothetical protein
VPGQPRDQTIDELIDKLLVAILDGTIEENYESPATEATYRFLRARCRLLRNQRTIAVVGEKYAFRNQILPTPEDLVIRQDLQNFATSNIETLRLTLSKTQRVYFETALNIFQTNPDATLNYSDIGKLLGKDRASVKRAFDAIKNHAARLHINNLF